jgi:putative restriction endonuclease
MHPPVTMPPLIRKAVVDAGFDLLLGSDGEWQRMGVSGTRHVVWILPSGAGALLAIAEKALLREFVQTNWTQVPLPADAAGAVRCRSADELLGTLHRTRMLLAQLPPAPQHEFAQRLGEVHSTEAEAIVRRRVGQELYREMLMAYWDGRCAVTGLAVPELLRASHAKPWKDADDRERLDVYNGLLLAVHLDALFDQGFITFDPDGTLLSSPALPTDALDLLVPDADDLRVGRLTDMHQPYLAYHRAHVFKASADCPPSPTGNPMSIP